MRLTATCLVALCAFALALTASAGEPAFDPERARFGHSVEGRTLRALRIGNTNRERTALVVGSIHGDETEGERIVDRLRERFRRLERVQLWLVETVNPDGVAAGTRTNARGVDLNRNFSYRWRAGEPPGSGYYPGPEPFSEPESRAVRRLAERIRPDVTIWYHQPWGQVLIPCEGRARLQKRYARIARMPVERCRGENLPGTATSWQRHRLGGIPFVVELHGGRLSGREVRRHARAAATVADRGARG